MTAKERHIAWKPNDLPTGGMDFVSLIDERDGLKIRLESFPPNENGRILDIRFEFPRAYRNIDEGYRLSPFPSFESEGQSIIYTIENSSFLEEFHRQSLDILKNFGLVHYFVVTVNDCIDVLSEVEPKIEWLR